MNPTSHCSVKVCEEKKYLYPHRLVDTSDENVDRERVSVWLSPPAREFVDSLRRDTGVPKVEALTRLIEWFASLDRKLRLAVLNRDAETREELMRLVVLQMSKEDAAARLGDELGPDDIVALMHVTAERAAKLFKIYTHELGVTPGSITKTPKKGMK